MLFLLFEGYETFALLLTIGASLHQLLPADQLSTLPRVVAYLISITLFGWAVGGVIGGVFGDRLGRRWTMIGASAVQHFRRHECAGAELADPRSHPVPHRRRHRGGMGRRHLAVAGNLAGTAADQRRRHSAGGFLRRICRLG